MNKHIYAILLILAMIASFFFGAIMSKKGIARSVDRIQATLSFSHLQVYKNLQTDFLSNCRFRVESRLEHIIDEQKMLIAEYVQDVSDNNFEEYINIRDRNLIKELRSYEINWNKAWILPECGAGNMKE